MVEHRWTNGRARDTARKGAKGMTIIGFEKKLQGHKWAAVVFTGALLAVLALVLALAAGPAKAACPPVRSQLRALRI